MRGSGVIIARKHQMYSYNGIFIKIINNNPVLLYSLFKLFIKNHNNFYHALVVSVVLLLPLQNIFYE